ncbi:hypothetical protein QZH41_008177 [Actinostola sp. cb2023]|nr:hypothetical protein QZH41_008177 [Actinostola sp. cb2023]
MQFKDQEQGLVLAGDGRCDSPGHCAKYGSYTVIEQTMNRVLDFQLVQSNEVRNSSWMELEGLKRSVDLLTTADLTIDTLITDRSRSIGKYIREELPDTTHYYDIWHVAKGLGKKIDKVAKQKDCGDIAEWKQSISNHMYWCAASTPDGNGDMIKAKWEILPLHIQDIHTSNNVLHSECGHGELEGERRDKLWMEQGERSYATVKLEDLLLNKILLKDVTKLSPVYQTSNLEAKHSLDIQFVPKHTAFSYWGMQTRLCLSALHYNENADRAQAVDKDGNPAYSITFPKAKKGQYSVRPRKTKVTYGLLWQL